jgi:hypothetical protein
LIVTTAKTRPTALGQPFSHWSIRKLADYLATKKGHKVRNMHVPGRSRSTSSVR